MKFIPNTMRVGQILDHGQPQAWSFIKVPKFIPFFYIVGQEFLYIFRVLGTMKTEQNIHRVRTIIILNDSLFDLEVLNTQLVSTDRAILKAKIIHRDIYNPLRAITSNI